MNFRGNLRSILNIYRIRKENTILRNFPLTNIKKIPKEKEIKKKIPKEKMIPNEQ